ncbi:hypothetical protein ACLB2K_050262 [Fragaria x ananassa]
MFSRGDHCEPFLILEAVALKDLWIWHSFFGLPGSHNDINVLEHSPLFTDLREGRAPPVNFRVNDHDYKMGYYLADGIYPSWSTFVKTIPYPQGEKTKNFANAQEGCRKNVERAFGVLQARFAIVKGPAHFWDCETLQKIMKACVIMHNMIIEDERTERIAFNDHAILARQYVELDEQFEDLLVSRNHTIEFEEFISNHLAIRDRGTHSMLQADLVELLWQLHMTRTNIFRAMQSDTKVNGGYALTGNARCSYVVRLVMRYNGKKRMKVASLCAITAKMFSEFLDLIHINGTNMINSR